MSSTAQTINHPPISNETAMQAQRMRGIGYARAAGVGLGIFYIGWAPANIIRWSGQGPTSFLLFEAFFFLIFGMLLVLPWKKIKDKKVWNFMFGALLVCSFLFTFIMVIGSLFQHSLAAEVNGRPAPPAFPGLQIFFGLMQVPTLLFQRRPELLD